MTPHALSKGLSLPKALEVGNVLQVGTRVDFGGRAAKIVDTHDLESLVQDGSSAASTLRIAGVGKAIAAKFTLVLTPTRPRQRPASWVRQDRQPIALRGPISQVGRQGRARRIVNQHDRVIALAVFLLGEDPQTAGTSRPSAIPLGEGPEDIVGR